LTGWAVHHPTASASGGRCHRCDALIAATALVRDMTVVTRDLKDFQRFDQLDVINPWS